MIKYLHNYIAELISQVEIQVAWLLRLLRPIFVEDSKIVYGHLWTWTQVMISRTKLRKKLTKARFNKTIIRGEDGEHFAQLMEEM